ncbi:MAG: bifunctional folylpolyglutamate synthase/dihydrofolate synthase, partial [Pseudomonadota bacterium]
PIERRAAEVGAPLIVARRDWAVHVEHGRLVYQDDSGLLDLDLPKLTGAHQIQNAGTAIAALRALGASDTAVQSAVADAEWPARMQRLEGHPLTQVLPGGTSLWLDGGHNAAAGEAIAAILDDWRVASNRPVHVICGMLDTKSAADFLLPLGPRVASLTTVEIPGAGATFSAEELAGFARDAGISAEPVENLGAAASRIASLPGAPGHVLICGSLYLAGHVMAMSDPRAS